MKHLILTSVLAIILSGFAGYYVGTITTIPHHVMEKTGELNAGTSVVHIENIHEGMLTGHIEGLPARIIARSNISITEKDGSFTLALADLGITSSKVEPIDIPQGAKFVASKQGKLFYPVESPSGKRISVKNRVYFKDTGEAMIAGYRSK